MQILLIPVSKGKVVSNGIYLGLEDPSRFLTLFLLKSSNKFTKSLKITSASSPSGIFSMQSFFFSKVS